MKVNFGTKGQLQIINIFSGGTFTTPALQWRRYGNVSQN